MPDSQLFTVLLRFVLMLESDTTLYSKLFVGKIVLSVYNFFVFCFNWLCQ